MCGRRAHTQYAAAERASHTSTCIPLRYLEEAGSTDSVDIQFTNVNKMKNRGEDFLAINPLGEGKVGASVYTYHPTL